MAEAADAAAAAADGAAAVVGLFSALAENRPRRSGYDILLARTDPAVRRVLAGVATVLAAAAEAAEAGVGSVAAADVVVVAEPTAAGNIHQARTGHAARTVLAEVVAAVPAVGWVGAACGKVCLL